MIPTLQPETSPAPPLLPAVTPSNRSLLWWVNRHLEKSSEPRRGEAGMIMIGDSLVHHFEIEGRTLWYLYFGAYRPLNLGFSADLTENALWRLRNGELDGLSPRLAVINIGTNNSGVRHDPPEQTAEGIRAIVRTLKEKLPDTQILLLGVFPRGPFPQNHLRTLNAQVNEYLPRIAAEECVHYLDIGAQFLDGRKVIHREIMRDFLHPTVLGYQIWAEAISPTVRRLMAPGSHLPGGRECQGA